jgi:hypothetical protein
MAGVVPVRRRHGVRRLLGCRCHRLARFGATRTGRFEHSGQGGGAERRSDLADLRQPGIWQRPSGGRQAPRLGDLLRRIVRLLDQPVADGAPLQAAQRGDRVLLRAAPAAGVAAGHDVGLDVDHQLGYLLGRTAALVMVLPRSRAGKLDGDVVTGHLAWGSACGSTRRGRP